MVPWGPCVAASRSERAAGFVGGGRRRSKEKGLALPSAGWIPGSSSKNPARSHLGRSRPGTSHSLGRSVLVVLRGLPACTACLPSCFLSPPYRILCKDRSFVCLVPPVSPPQKNALYTVVLCGVNGLSCGRQIGEHLRVRGAFLVTLTFELEI